jgi:hypothetical protein
MNSLNLKALIENISEQEHQADWRYRLLFSAKVVAPAAYVLRYISISC